MLTRRSFFGAAGLTATGLLSQPLQILNAKPSAVTELGKVKIRDIKTAVVKIKKYNTTLVKVTTNQEFYGLEPKGMACIASRMANLKTILLIQASVTTLSLPFSKIAPGTSGLERGEGLHALKTKSLSPSQLKRVYPTMKYPIYSKTAREASGSELITD